MTALLTALRRPAAPVAEISVAGVWTWFNKPRAITVSGMPIVGSISTAGSIQAHTATATPTTTTIGTANIDDHSNPALLQRSSDGKGMAWWADHNGNTYMQAVTTLAGDFTAWGAPVNIAPQLGLSNYSYAQPHELSDGLRLFFRADTVGGERAFHMCTSVDDGTTWGTPVQVLDGSYVYIRSARNSGDRIDFCCSPHPDGNNVGSFTSSVYHFYYDGSTFRDTGGTALTLPINPAVDLTPIWDGSTAEGHGWIWDIAVDGSGHPAIAYAVFPRVQDARYRYARYNGATWADNEICKTGGRLVDAVDDSTQPYYVPGIAIDPDDASVCYLAQRRSGTWKMLRAVTADSGATWTFREVAEASGVKVFRPTLPQGSASEPRLAFLDGSYTDGDTFSTDIRLVDSRGGTNAAPSAVTLTPPRVYDTEIIGGVVGRLSAVSPDFDEPCTFSIVSDPDSKFSISGDQLQLAATVDHTVSAAHSVTIRATDTAGQTTDTALTVDVLDGTKRVAVLQTVLEPSLTTFDVTQPGFGAPKAVIVVLGTALENGVSRNSAVGSVGASDGTDQWSSEWGANNGVSGADVVRSFATGKVAGIHNGTNNYVVRLSVDSFIADGVRFSMDANAGRIPYVLTVILIGGSAVSAKAGSGSFATQDNTVTVTPGFQTRALLLSSAALGADSFAAGVAINSLGFGAFDGSTVTQASAVYRSDEATSTATQGDIRSNGVMTLPVGRYASLQSVTSTAFDLLSTGGDLSGWSYGYLALGGIDAWAGVVDSPTTTGAQTITGPSFTPKAALLSPRMFTATATQQTGGEASGFGIGAVTAHGEAAYGWADRDNVSVSDSSVESAAKGVLAPDHTGAVAFEGTFDAFTATGVTVDFTTTQGSAKKWLAWFLG